MRSNKIVFCLPLSIALANCNSNSPTAFGSIQGEFDLLTYNIAGLPQGISPSNPAINIPLMSPLLNNYDLVLVQEDFFYHEELAAEANHPYKSSPKSSRTEFTSSDGLNRFSNFAMGDFSRITWQQCSNIEGDDCRAQKGFSRAEIELAGGITVDVYNLHMDSGSSVSDIAARSAQISQMLNTIDSRSAGKAIIVAGDTNLDPLTRVEDDSLLDILLSSAGLTDACEQLACDRTLVDRIFYRSSNELRITAQSWEIDDDFVDNSGQKLSDHYAIAARFQWETSKNE